MAPRTSGEVDCTSGDVGRTSGGRLDHTEHGRSVVQTRRGSRANMVDAAFRALGLAPERARSHTRTRSAPLPNTLGPAPEHAPPCTRPRSAPVRASGARDADTARPQRPARYGVYRIAPAVDTDIGVLNECCRPLRPSGDSMPTVALPPVESGAIMPAVIAQ